MGQLLISRTWGAVGVIRMPLAASQHKIVFKRPISRFKIFSLMGKKGGARLKIIISPGSLHQRLAK